ncbi:MAG: hypothetical protein ACRDU4_20120 [Mycobacterium sp.]
MREPKRKMQRLVHDMLAVVTASAGGQGGQRSAKATRLRPVLAA